MSARHRARPGRLRVSDLRFRSNMEQVARIREQLANRAIAYAGRYVAIAVAGLLETFNDGGDR